MKTVPEWFYFEPKPKNVGASEYHVVHEHVRNVIDSEDDPRESHLGPLIECSLDELITYAQEMKRSLQRTFTPSPETTGEYKCPKCGNTESFRGVDDRMYGIQDFWLDENGEVEHGTYESDGMGAYSAIYCNSDDGCEALIWPLPPTE